MKEKILNKLRYWGMYSLLSLKLGSLLALEILAEAASRGMRHLHAVSIRYANAARTERSLLKAAAKQQVTVEGGAQEAEDLAEEALMLSDEEVR